MTPAKLVLLRLVLLTLGRFTWGSKCIRFLLMNVVRRGGKMTYVAHADFLDLRRLHPQGLAEPMSDPKYTPEPVHTGARNAE